MSLHSLERSFETALSSLATSTVDVSVLTSAPQAALLLQGITVLAACVIDASLENDKTRKAIKLLNTPGSFKASLYQMGSAIGDSFRVAHRAMMKIKINLVEIPDIMASMVTAYAKPEDEGSTFVIQLQMESFSEILNMCSKEATNARQSFDDTMKLIQEMIQVTTATAGHNEEQVREAEKLLASYNKHKDVFEEEKRILHERIEKHKKEIDAIMTKYDKDTEKMSDSWTVLTATVAGSVDDIFKLFNGEKMSMGASQTGSKIPDMAVRNLSEAAQLAEKVYIHQKQIEQILLEQYAANHQTLNRIAAKMAGVELEKLKFKDIVFYLSRTIPLIGQVQAHWSAILDFFSALDRIVIGPMTKHLENFDKAVKAENLKNTGILRNSLLESGFKSVALSLSVARIAGIYTEISEKYVMPLVDQSVGKLTMSKEEAKAELPHLKSNMKRITEETHRFLDEKLKAVEKETVKEMKRCRHDFYAALSQPLSRLRLR